MTAGSSQSQNFTMLTQTSGLSANLEDIVSSAAAPGRARHVQHVHGLVRGGGHVPHVRVGQHLAAQRPDRLTDPTDTASAVGLSWNASTDSTGTLAGYTVYRNGKSIGTTNASTTTFTDSTVQPSTTYSYTVDAFDTAGNHSAQSSALQVTTPGAPPPSASGSKAA